MSNLFENEKDYTIHTPEADAERERRIKIMREDRERRGFRANAPEYYCEKCGMWLHGPEFLFCACLYDKKQKYDDMQKEIENRLKDKQ